MIDFAVGGFGSGPVFPAELFFEDVGVFAGFEFGFLGAVVFEAFEVFEEEKPGGLFGVIEFGGAARFFAENVVDVSEGLFEHVCACDLPDDSGEILLQGLTFGRQRLICAVFAGKAISTR
jgi:hypothetical protein